ncbi:MAG: YciI family protein [Myxococcaceae bacterium]
MRFMVLVKATKESEAGQMPSKELINEMGKFNTEMVKAGVLLDGNGLSASSKGKRLTWGNGKVDVIDGPFAETKELVSGFWMIQVKSMDEAVEWIRRAPMIPGSNVEIRKVMGPEDFGPEFAEEMAKEAKLAAQLEAQKKQG